MYLCMLYIYTYDVPQGKPELRSWVGARMRCEQLGYDLVAIHDADVNREVQHVLDGVAALPAATRESIATAYRSL